MIRSLLLLFVSVFCLVFSVDCQTISTIAGNGTGGFLGDGAPATTAEINAGYLAIADTSGNVYIADAANNRVRKVNTSGIISTIAGTGAMGSSGDGGPAISALLNFPTALAFDKYGNLYIAELFGNRIRKVTPTGTISTVAGTSGSGYSGEGVVATAASLSSASGVAVDTAGNIYIADRTDNRIRKVTASTGLMTTIAGTGTAGDTGDGSPATAGEINGPFHIAVDKTGQVYICENGGHRIRKVSTSGIISTFAGTGTSGFFGDGGPATAAQLNSPVGVAVDSFLNVYIADQTNNRIREVTASGIINTVAGNGIGAFSGDGGPATAAEINTPQGVWVDQPGNIYIGDVNNERIRKVTACITPTGTIGGTFSLCTGSTTTLTETVSGGAWSSSNPSVASIGSTGLVTAVSAGTVNITYSVSGSCGTAIALQSFTVNTTPTGGIISGSSTVCVAGSVTLSESVTGGVWSSSSTSVAAIGSSSGLLSGVSAGTATITYTVSNACGSATATWPVTVNPLPATGTILGSGAVCTGATTPLSETVGGGLWSAFNTNASVSAGGVVTGVITGADTIYYTVTNACGAAHASMLITIDSLPLVPGISGSDTVCIGHTTALTDAVGGGTWVSVFTTAATVSSAGVVTGVAAGIDTIKYSVANTCGTSTVKYVMHVLTSGCHTAGLLSPGTAGDVSVYPNPTNGVFTISGNTGAQPGNQVFIEIADMVGQTIYRQSLESSDGLVNERISLETELPNGVYIISLYSGDYRKMFRVVLARP